MKKIKQLSIIFTIFLSSMFLFINCNNENLDEETFTYSSGKIDVLKYYNEKNNTSKTLRKGGINNVIDSLIIETVLISSIEVPENLNENELIEFFNNHSQELNGSLMVKMNDEIISTTDFLNGNEITSELSKTQSELYSSKMSGDCSYEGVRQCTKKRIDSKTTLSKLICAFTAGQCIAEETANCIIQECF
jgi:hypothetical protein